MFYFFSYFSKRNLTIKLGVVILSKSKLGDVLKKHHYTCQYCGRTIRSRNEVILHHIINRVNGGSNTGSNLVPRHKECEEKAHLKHPHGNREEGLNVLGDKKGGYIVRINGRDVHITYPHKNPKTTTEKPQPARSRFDPRRVLS